MIAASPLSNDQPSDAMAGVTNQYIADWWYTYPSEKY